MQGSKFRTKNLNSQIRARFFVLLLQLQVVFFVWFEGDGDVLDRRTQNINILEVGYTQT